MRRKGRGREKTVKRRRRRKKKKKKKKKMKKKKLPSNIVLADIWHDYQPHLGDLPLF